MKPLSLGVALLVLIAVVPVAAASTATDAERQIMASVNRARADRGLVPLRSDYRLWILADERAKAMASAESSRSITSRRAMRAVPRPAGRRFDRTCSSRRSRHTPCT